MKKIVSLLLSATLLTTLASCGVSESHSSRVTDSQSQPASESSSEETSSDSGTESTMAVTPQPDLLTVDNLPSDTAMYILHPDHTVSPLLMGFQIDETGVVYCKENGSVPVFSDGDQLILVSQEELYKSVFFDLCSHESYTLMWQNKLSQTRDPLADYGSSPLTDTLPREQSYRFYFPYTSVGVPEAAIGGVIDPNIQIATINGEPAANFNDQLSGYYLDFATDDPVEVGILQGTSILTYTTQPVQYFVCKMTGNARTENTDSLLVSSMDFSTAANGYATIDTTNIHTLSAGTYIVHVGVEGSDFDICGALQLA